MQDKIKQLLKDIQNGDAKSLARAITIVENELSGYDEMLMHLNHTLASKVIGITGPPGAGKSTLVNSLLQYWIKENKKIAVLAIDPSSPFNYGALLGDRIRMTEFYNHPNVFIRSLASRGELGGLSNKILEITDIVKHAPFDYILVETVGVGQSEVEIAGLADCTIVALVPEAGDEVQTLKAGIMEIADIFVVNKADRDLAQNLYTSLKTLVHERATKEKEIAVIKTIAIINEGISELATSIELFLNENVGISPKKLHLLTDKSWQLIQANRMKGINKLMIKSLLSEEIKQSDFNLYSFIAKFN